MARVVEHAEVTEWRTDLLREEVRTAFGFLEKLNALPEEIGPEDVRALRDAGLSDEAIRDAIYVCASFNVIDRLADAFGFDVPSPEKGHKAARFLLRIGYRG